MSGVAYNNILTIFPSAEQYVFDIIKKEDVEVHICECYLSKSQFIEYRFYDKKVFDKFLIDSGWLELPHTNQFNFKFFNAYENGKFLYKKA